MKNFDRILTVPNFITLLRFLAIPIFIYFMINKQINLGLFVYIIAVISDTIDGNVARYFHQESRFGSVFDPVVDFCIILSSLIILFILNYITLAHVILFILPRIITFGLILYCKNKNSLLNGDYFRSIYAKVGSGFFIYLVIGLLILKADYYIIFACFVLIYIFSSIHWFLMYKDKKRREFETLTDI